jgi:hypothetical protein
LVLIGIGSGAASEHVTLSQWTLDMPTDLADVTVFNAGNKLYVQGIPDVSGKLSGFWDSASDTLYDAMASATSGTLWLYPNRLTSSKYFCGAAWFDFSIDTSVGDAVKISGSFKAAGAWTQA